MQPGSLRDRFVRRASTALLAILAGALAHPPAAYPQAPAPSVTLPATDAEAPWRVPIRLLAGDDGAWRLTAATSLALALRVRTSIETAAAAEPVEPTAEAMFATPLLFWSARDGAELAPDARIALGQFLSHGGLLVIDGDPGRDAGFLAQAEALAAEALPPGATLGPLGDNDILLHTFYLLRAAQGRSPGDVRTARIDGNVALIVSHADLLGGLGLEGEAGREPSTRFLVNVVMYALCLDYKDDQVHAPFLMRRRRGAP